MPQVRLCRRQEPDNQEGLGSGWRTEDSGTGKSYTEAQYPLFMCVLLYLDAIYTRWEMKWERRRSRPRRTMRPI